MTGSLLLLALLLSISLRVSDAACAARLARAGILALLLPVLALVALATLGIRLPSWATLILLLLCILFSFPWGKRYSLGREDWSVLTLAALAALTGTAALATQPTILQDLYAHLAWSKDLVGAKDLYPLGFPALFQLTSVDLWPLIDSLRVLPTVLGIVFVLQCIAIGEHFGSRTAGALAGLAYMLKSTKVDPSLPEFFGVILILASWKEILTYRYPSSLRWLALLSFALVVVHVSTLEMVHFALLAPGLLFLLDRPLGTRFISLGVCVLGAASGVLISPMLRSIVFGDGPLLASQQPSQLDPFHVGAMAWIWGYGFALALAASVLLLLKGCLRDGRWRWVFLFAFGSALLIAPTVLARFGIEIPLQMFSGRQYLSALLFACLAWLVLIARAPGLLKVGFAVLLTGQIAHGSGLDPARTVVVAGGLALILLGLHRKPIGKGISAFAVLTLAAIGLRIVLWTPQTPPWVEWFQSNTAPGSVVLANWPATNALDGMTSARVYDGVAGADANLALHRLRTLPAYREQLNTCDPDGALSVPLATVLDSLSSEGAYVLIHKDYEFAWAHYAQVYESIKSTGDLDRFVAYRATPCSVNPSSRLQQMNRQLVSTPGFSKVYGDQECDIYRYTRSED